MCRPAAYSNTQLSTAGEGTARQIYGSGSLDDFNKTQLFSYWGYVEIIVNYIFFMANNYTYTCTHMRMHTHIYYS